MTETKIIAIIQARMGSQRFPGKTMYRIGGKTCLEHHLDAVIRVFPRRHIFIASSTEPGNDIIETFAGQAKINIYRGSENNVARRFLDILQTEIPDMFVRLNADSPLLDYRIILAALEKMQSVDADIVSTAADHPFSSGMNVEVIRRDIFERTYPCFTRNEHFEHVTRYFYENRPSFLIESLPCPIENPRSYKFTFDTEQDARRLETFFDQLQRPHYEYSLKEKCEIYDRLFGSISHC